MCGWWRTLSYGVDQRTGAPREVRFDKVDPSAAPMYRKEKLAGAGRGSKEAKVELLESKGIMALPEALKEQIKEQCHKILEALEGGNDGRETR